MSAAPFASIVRNAPGTVVFQTRRELEQFVMERTGLMASLTAIMPHLIDTGPTGPEFSYLEDLALLMQDHAYQLEQATRLLVGGKT
nr:hypothetical protein [Variovorax boronicumulans]